MNHLRHQQLFICKMYMIDRYFENMIGIFVFKNVINFISKINKTIKLYFQYITNSLES